MIYLTYLHHLSAALLASFLILVSARAWWVYRKASRRNT
jgi:cbb3-type cytochrome oxidase subunit 3